MNTFRFRFIAALGISLLLLSCSSLKVLEPLTPISGAELAAKREALSEDDLQQWLASDPQRDSVPGISLNRVNASLKTKPRKAVVVAIVAVNQYLLILLRPPIQYLLHHCQILLVRKSCFDSG